MSGILGGQLYPKRGIWMSKGIYRLQYPIPSSNGRNIHRIFWIIFRNRFQDLSLFTCKLCPGTSQLLLSFNFVCGTRTKTVTPPQSATPVLQVIKGSYLDWRPEGWRPDLAVHNNSIEDYEDKKTVD